MKVVIVSATENEILQIKQGLQSANKTQHSPVSFHTTGVGIMASCFYISQLIFKQKPTVIIQAGIAGSFSNNHPIGKVVAVKNEFVADSGVEENGIFKDLFDLNFLSENSFPYKGKGLTNTFMDQLNYLQLEEVTGITINEITTRPVRIEAIKKKFQPAIESMEGAALHYCCLLTATPFIQIRAISNYVGERDKLNWNFKEAFNNLTKVVLEYLRYLDGVK